MILNVLLTIGTAAAYVLLLALFAGAFVWAARLIFEKED